MGSFSIWHWAVLALPVFLGFLVAVVIILFRRKGATRKAERKEPHWH